MSKDFRLLWEIFINGFDSIEESGVWDKDRYGEMEAYCENILISVLCHFISVDNVVTVKEVGALNRMFGYEYSVSDIENICKNMAFEVREYVENPAKLISMIEAANTNIAKSFKELVSAACEQILSADDIVLCEEIEFNKFLKNFNK